MSTLSLPQLSVVGQSDSFPIRRIYCVGRNYAAHAAEMGADSNLEPPFFFSKPADALWQNLEDNNILPYPPRTNDLHHEVELVVAIGSTATNISPSDSESHIFGYAVGVDLTRRDLQSIAKEQRRPWDMSKGFDHSAPMSSLSRASDIGHPNSEPITLSVNGDLRQQGNLSDQLWSVPDIIANLSTYVTLRTGDLIMTGTPSGVGSLVASDIVEAKIESVGTLVFTMGTKPII